MNDPYDYDHPVKTPGWAVTTVVALSFAAITTFILLLALQQAV